jgi:hypothetical protein
MPAMPAAAVLAARGAWSTASRALVILSAPVTLLLIVSLALWPNAGRWISDYGLVPIALGGVGILLAGSVGAALASRSAHGGISAIGAGWFGFYAALALAAGSPATELHASKRPPAFRPELVRHRRRLPQLHACLPEPHPVPLADYLGELEPWFEPNPSVRESLFWTRERFWSEWKSGRRIVALVSTPDLAEFRSSRMLLVSRKYSLASNY